MTFVGAVERLGIPGDSSTRDLPFVLFAFEETLIFAELSRGPLLSPKLFRPSDQDRRLVQEILASRAVIPESVLLRWPNAATIATSDIREARLKRRIDFYRTRKLTLDLVGNTTYAMWAIPTSLKPLRGVLVSVLGERFQSS
jgi:hypothetical protein